MTSAAECQSYLSEGSVYPRDTETPTSASDWAANPTLLDPVTRGWTLHYGACPFLGYSPLDGGQHPRALTLVSRSRSAL